jgi:hypothetical protein
MVTIYIAHQGRSSYLHSCIKSAISSNNNVVYIGDCDYVSSLINSEDMYSPLEIDDSRFMEFCSIWTNLSFNQHEFELGCFRRFFYIYEIAKKRGDLEFWMCDSDVLIFQDLEIIMQFIRNNGFECALSSPMSDKPYFWASSPHCSFWTLKSLGEFLKFMEETYRVGRQDLLLKFQHHEINNQPGGVCDMTLLNLWLNKKNIKVLNLCRLNGFNLFIDHNMNSTSNFFDDSDEFLIEPFLKIKKIICKAGHPHVVEIGGKKIKVLALHFQGGAKKYMQRVRQVKSTSPLLFFDILLINCIKFCLKRVFKIIHKLKIKVT